MASEYIEQLEEEAQWLAEYYTGVTGRDIRAGVEPSGDIWISSNRTYDKEYFDYLALAEDRIKQLYSDYLIEDDYSDPLEDF